MSTLANSANVALTASQLGINNINSIPRMQGVSTSAMDNATPQRGQLSVTKVNMSNYDAAVARCASLTNYTDVQNMNKSKGVTSTDTSCGWIQYTQGGSAGASVLGTNFSVIGPIPSAATSASKYFSPLLTTSSKTVANNWTNAIQCRGSTTSLTCSSEPFTNPSGKFAGVDHPFSTPFLQKYPLSSTTPLSRDKFIQVDTHSGAMAPTLFQDSERGLSDPSMETSSSYSIFTKAMTHPGAQDKDSWQKAFLTSQPVVNDMPRPSRGPVFATNLDQHNFCAEMNEQTIINENNLACLQQEWLRKGGKETDYNYPDTRLYGSCYGRVVRK
jgi:hypothetical protein